MQPDPEKFLDEILREVGEVKAAAYAMGGADGGGVRARGVTGGGGGVGEDGGGGRTVGGGATKYSLAASAAGEYDPTFIRLDRTKHQVRGGGWGERRGVSWRGR